MSYPKPLRKLIQQLTRLPGIGEKSATRLALHMLRMPKEAVRELGQTIAGICDAVLRCNKCHNIADQDPCAL